MSLEKKPSEKVLASAFDGKEVVDSKGRKLKLRKPDILDFYDLMSAIGDDSKSPICQHTAMNVLYVASIDGQVVASPKSHREFRATLQRIGFEGIQAINEFMANNFDEEDLTEQGQIEKAKK